MIQKDYYIYILGIEGLSLKPDTWFIIFNRTRRSAHEVLFSGRESSQKRTSHVGFESKYYPSHYMYIYIYTHIFCSPTKFALTYLLVILLNALLRTKKASMSQQEAETNHDPGTWKQWGFHDGLMSMVGVEQCIGEILLMVQKSCKNHLGWC